MQSNLIQMDDVQSFLKSVESGTDFTLPNQPALEGDNTNQPDPNKGPVDQSQTVQQMLDGTVEGTDKDGGEGTKPGETQKEDITAYVEYFKEKGVLLPYEDETFPTTKEELMNALEQSSQHSATVKADEVLKQKISSFTPQVQSIIDYAKDGMMTATEVKNFINSVSAYEQVSQLDPKDEKHQEGIIRMHLTNTGLDEETIAEQLDLFKSTNQVGKMAEKFINPLKETYKKEYQSQMLEKQKREDNLQNHLQTNASNVKYFLEKDQSYLPFKIEDNTHKAQVYELGAQVVKMDEGGNPVYGWQQFMENLQSRGDEASYKKFMKIINFMANDELYDKKLSKVASTDTKQKEFKNIKDTRGPAGNSSPELQQKQATIQRTSHPFVIK